MKSLQGRLIAATYAAALLFSSVAATAADASDKRECRYQTKVAVLGAGVAGITAAQTLANHSISDFLIVDRNDYIGGRVRSTTFGSRPPGAATSTNGTTTTPYTVELGANWVQGLSAGDGGPENPIWALAKKHGIANTYSNYSSILTYDEDGAADFGDLFDQLDEGYAIAEQDAGRLLTENLQDTSMRAGFSTAGWKPGRTDMRAQALEWWYWDFETSWPPEQSGFVFGIAGYNLTYYQWNEENNFVWDQRGFNTFVEGEAAEFLEGPYDDPRLLLETTVKGISYGPEGVIVSLEGGDCIEAQFAICTFSVGVLQNDVVTFDPALPRWKREAIDQFQVGTYTKIFMQFDEAFWDPDTQFFLYADGRSRGYYPVFQSLTAPGFLEDSGILFVTVVGSQSYRVEQQSDEVTKAEIMEVLRAMFPDKEIPEPTDFMYPRWSTEEWVYGSYSNWPVGMTLEKHQNLRANVDRLYFAGEGTSAQYFGFLQGAWYEGRDVGLRVAGLLRGGEWETGECNANTTIGCGSMVHYGKLYGTTHLDEYNVSNGWPTSSFTYNVESD